MIRLRVWANAQPMGWFGHEAAQYFFQYDERWIRDALAFSLAPQFVLRLEPYRGEAVKTFFANLLPEGVPLDEVLNQIQIRDLGHRSYRFIPAKYSPNSTPVSGWRNANSTVAFRNPILLPQS